MGDGLIFFAIPAVEADCLQQITPNERHLLFGRKQNDSKGLKEEMSDRVFV